MRIKKLSAMIMAAMLACTTPVMVYADVTTEEAVDAAVEILENTGVDSLLSDPDTVVDIIIYAKNMIGEQDVSDDQIYDVIHMAEEEFNFSISDDEEETLVKLFKKFQDMDLDEEELRETVTKVYDTMEKLGITEDDVKGIISKAIDFVKNILE